jgi:predicted GNAT family acetyltransferase
VDNFVITDNKKLQRFETHVDDDIAFVEYRMHAGTIYLMHTFVPEKLRGRRIADALATFALGYVEKNKLPVKIYCPFITAFIHKHPELERWRQYIRQPGTE